VGLRCLFGPLLLLEDHVNYNQSEMHICCPAGHDLAHLSYFSIPHGYCVPPAGYRGRYELAFQLQ